MSFTGFKPSLMKFLKELEKNNDRDWFADNKQRYEDLVVEGYARPPAARMDNQSREVFLNLGYTFAPDYVLVETFPPSP